MRPSKRRHRRRAKDDTTPEARYPEIPARKHLLPAMGKRKRRMSNGSERRFNNMRSC